MKCYKLNTNTNQVSMASNCIFFTSSLRELESTKISKSTFINDHIPRHKMVLCTITTEYVSCWCHLAVYFFCLPVESSNPTTSMIVEWPLERVELCEPLELNEPPDLNDELFEKLLKLLEWRDE